MTTLTATEPAHAAEPPTITVAAWYDPALDARGHDPRSIYVELVWGGIVGPQRRCCSGGSARS